MINGYWRDLALKLYVERNYTKDPVTLALGVCEEAGELGKAVNWFHNPLYKRNLNSTSDSVEHEIRDLLLYIAALANALNINIKF
jgi:NTP pyrophosphatase (non-canonical NTP hydrolase)